MEKPDSADLLAIARTTLQDDVIPHLTGDARFKALMIANAMAIAERAARLAPNTHTHTHTVDLGPICAMIRAGSYDHDTDMAQRLLAEAEARCRISSKRGQT